MSHLGNFYHLYCSVVLVRVPSTVVRFSIVGCQSREIGFFVNFNLDMRKLWSIIVAFLSLSKIMCIMVDDDCTQVSHTLVGDTWKATASKYPSVFVKKKFKQPTLPVPSASHLFLTSYHHGHVEMNGVEEIKRIILPHILLAWLSSCLAEAGFYTITARMKK